MATTFRVDVQIKAISSVQHKTNPFPQFLTELRPNLDLCARLLGLWLTTDLVVMMVHLLLRRPLQYEVNRNIQMTPARVCTLELNGRRDNDTKLSTSAAELFTIAWPTTGLGDKVVYKVENGKVRSQSFTP